jgi:hypothetical protein
MFSFTNPLTIEELQTELNNHYDKIKYKYAHNQTLGHPSQHQPRPQGLDRAFFAGRKFKDTCNKCGKIGNRAVDCHSGGRGNQININDHLQQHLPQELLTQEELGILLVKLEVETVLDSQERVLIVRKLVTVNLSVSPKFVMNVMLLMQL